MQQQDDQLMQLRHLLSGLQNEVSDLHLQCSGNADEPTSLVSQSIVDSNESSWGNLRQQIPSYYNICLVLILPSQETANGAFGSMVLDESPRSLIAAATADASVTLRQLKHIAQHLSSSWTLRVAGDSAGDHPSAVSLSTLGASQSAASPKDQLDDSKDDLPALHAQLDTLSAESKTLQVEADVLRLQLTTMQYAAEEAATLQEEVDSLRKQLAAFQQDAELVNAQRQELAAQEAKLHEFELAQHQQVEMTEEVSKLREENASLRQEASGTGDLREEVKQLQLALIEAEQKATLMQQHSVTAPEAYAEPQNEQHADPETSSETHQRDSADVVDAQQDQANRSASDLDLLRQQVLQLQSDLADAQQHAQPSQEELTDASRDTAGSCHGGQASASLQNELSKAHQQIAQLQEEVAGQQAASQPGIDGMLSLSASASMVLSQFDLVEAASDAMQVC